MNRFPAFLDIAGRRAVIVGGGAAAARKGRLLAAAGADLLFVAETIDPALEAEFDDRAGILNRAPRQADFFGAAIAVIAVTDPGEASRFAAMARAEGALVNAVDRPAASDFIIPSIIDRDSVVVAVSTGGSAPVLARRLRGAIEALLPARLGALADFARRFRAAVAGKLSPPARRQFWERFFDGPVAAQLLAGDARGARESMIAAVNRAGANESEGVVHIVGAGPGDPELLTLKAHRLLQEADVIFYDRLVGEDILTLARRDADRVYVGKAKGKHAVAQEEICRRMIDAARRGKTVVRLKGGDPMIFGRGGEELEALEAAGVAAFVTPGVTAAAACAAAAGMALTHRDCAQGLTFITGHGKNGAEPALDWAALARLDHTLAVYMGVGKAGAIADKLIAHGASPSTPVMVIENGTRRNQKILKGGLAALGEVVEKGGVKGPAMLVVGAVAARARAGAERAAVEADWPERSAA